MTDTDKRPVRVCLISLGCAKNLVDAEIMLGSLLQGGAEIINDASQADVVIVNTCSFIDAAQEESVDAILQSAELREAQNRGQGLIVSGCLPQRFREELPQLLPEVDAFMGLDQVTQVTEIVHEAIQRRRQRLAPQSVKSRITGQRSKVLARFAQLETGSAISHHPEKIRGTEESGGTATFASSRPAVIESRQPSTPLVQVHARPNYIPDFATPRFR